MVMLGTNDAGMSATREESVFRGCSPIGKVVSVGMICGCAVRKVRVYGLQDEYGE